MRKQSIAVLISIALCLSVSSIIQSEASFASRDWAKGKFYALGDTGPGGGLIFFIDEDGFKCKKDSNKRNLCNYLEVAPYGWNLGGVDPFKTWSTANYQFESVPGLKEEDLPNNIAIGLGFKNSNYILRQGNDSTTAAGIAREYGGGGLRDWYLPDLAELNALCQWNHGIRQTTLRQCIGGTLNSPKYGADTSGFASIYYWSSSVYDKENAWVQFFGPGLQANGGKFNPWFVRPIRAF